MLSIINDPEVISSLSDKVKLFAINSPLDNKGHSLSDSFSFFFFVNRFSSKQLKLLYMLAYKVTF